MEITTPNYRTPLTAGMAREISAKAELTPVRDVASKETLFKAFEKIRRASKRGDRYAKVLAPDYVTIDRGVTTLSDSDKKFVMATVQSTLSEQYYDFNVEVNDAFDELTVNW